MLELKLHTLRHHEDLYGKVLENIPYKHLIYDDGNHWTGIFKRSFIQRENIWFNETSGAAAQDAGFVSQTSLLAKERLYIPDAMYYYRQDNPGSSMKSPRKVVFSCQELSFLLNLYEKNRKYESIFERFYVVDRYFSLFMENYYRYIIQNQNDYSHEIQGLKKTIAPFFGKYQQYIDSASFIYMFLHDEEAFGRYLRCLYQYNENTRKRSLQKIFKADEVVIFGAGDLGECLYIHLLFLGFNGKIEFCDNVKQGLLYYDKKILTVDEAVKRNTEACYVITNRVYMYEMSDQLQRHGVKRDNIILIEGLFGFNVFQEC